MSVSNIRSAAKFRQTVLLIDDQPTVLAIHTAILKSLKMNLKIVSMIDPLEALSWMQNKQVDLVISDFHMPQMDGMQFVEAIKSAQNGLLRYIIVVTVLKDKAVHQALISAGAAACLTKPVQTLELANVARNLLDKSKQNYDITT
jgi:two-component system, chemotaxis family, chemotaxis protein CheY